MSAFAYPPGVGRPASGPLSFWREQPEVNPATRSDARQCFMRFRGKADLCGPVRRRRHPPPRLSRKHRTTMPDRDRPVRLARFNRWCDAGEDGDRAAWLSVSRWLTSTACAQRSRRAGMAPPFRLAMPEGCQGAVVLRDSRRETACRCWCERRPRPVTVRSPLRHIVHSRRSSCRYREAACSPPAARRGVDRGDRRPTEPYSERVHLGTMGRARLPAVEPPSSCNSAMGYMCHDARGTA